MFNKINWPSVAFTALVVDQIDLALAPCSGGTSQPDVITMWHALRGTEYTLDVDITKIMKLEQMFKEAMKDYFVPPEATAVEPLIPFFPMPGGALTANTQMLAPELRRFGCGGCDRGVRVFARVSRLRSQ
jgi:pyruvate/oxaloacetate carboxyltransferase